MTSNHHYVIACERITALSDARTSSFAGKEPTCSIA